MRFWQIYSIEFLIATVTCVHTDKTKSKNPLPYYARQNIEEEDLDDTNKSEVPVTDESDNNLVSFLVNNVKEIFDKKEDIEVCTYSTKTSTFTSENLKQTSETNYTIIHDPKLVDEVVGIANMSQMSVINPNLNESIPLVSKLEMDKEHMMQFRKEISLKKSQQKLLDESFSIIDLSNTNNYKRQRSCIFCDNVRFEDCSYPKKKLIRSVVCKNESDLCYSQHTPFGIVDRGCFSPESSLITYVCSCNLCNFISFSEMPYVFKNQREWVQNVVELSRTKNLIRSVFRNMACLRCEVNTSERKENSDDDANCLEGNIGSIPTQICDENEICAVKVIKSKGYIWRGCVGSPLYNYWWNLCNTDLCNYDNLISVFDYL